MGQQGERVLVTCSLRLAVSGDALQLMAELLKIFVVGEQRGPIASSGVPPRLVWVICDPFTFFSEAIKTPFSHFPTSTLSLKISVFQKSQPCLLSCQLAQGWENSQGCGQGGWGSSPPSFLYLTSPRITAEAAIRSVRQAQAEELDHVDVEQLEKVLPQLVGGPPEQGLGGEWVGGPHP